MAGRLWREAASLMVVDRGAKLNSKIANKDFRLLFLKRSGKSSFMPNSYVFPGGVIESSDFSEDWLDVFKKCGYKPDDLIKGFRTKGPQPQIYTNKSYHIIPEVGFRIGALREAFEECGLLLTHHLPYKSLNQSELSKWQKIVHQDASKFVVIFQELGGCPAIWDLHEWITWLTPVHSPRRFDTVFFITFMDKIPDIVADNTEVVDVKVTSPTEIMKLWHSRNVTLPPPQLYEVSRLLGFDSYEELEGFAQERGKKGLDRYFPVKITTKNGLLVCLPGDDLYPEEPDYAGDQKPVVLQESFEELRNRGKNFHRMETKSFNESDLIINTIPKFGHRPPISPINFLKNKL